MPRLLSLGCAVLLSVSMFAAGRPIDFSAKGARVHRTEDLKPLTAPSRSPRAEIVRAFLTECGRGAAAASLQLAGENPRGGVTHLRMEQQVAGLPVYGTYAKATLDGEGRLLSLVENAVAPSHVVRAQASANEAIAAAIALHHGGPKEASFWHREPSATRVAVPLADGTLHEGWLVETWEEESNLLWHTVVAGDGSVVHAELRTASDTYKIFPDHPGNSTQTVVNGPGSGNAESPIGWVATNTTTGNNVDAYLDRDNNNAADSGGRPVSSTLNFEFTADLTQAPTISVNQMAAVTNLFYLNNVIHDKLYRHGFNEAAGNFQANNFGKGGSGNDPVNAEAQDGGGTNNANFSTPADGSRPRMQMYIWTRSTPSRDGDLDSDIPWHEYGHGLTWRMIGGMSGPLAGAIGEGMADTLAIYINRNDVVGEYSNNNVKGIRRFPYTNYPNTYGDVTGSSVHADGEIYAATMWKLLALWEAAGHTQNELFDYVIDGMNFTPSRPAYEEMRDGILAAVPTAAQDCIVWTAFAQFGIGQGAAGTESCSIFTCSVNVTESFVVPSTCTGPVNTAPSVTITAPANNSSFVQGSSVTFSGTAADAEDGTISSSLSWSSSRDGALGSGASITTSALTVGTHTITARATDSGGLSGSSAINVTITSTTPSPITLSVSGRKVKGVATANLTWSGATSAQVDVYRNNVRVTTTANDGAHTDQIGKGGGTLTYRVCEAGTNTCSNNASVSF
ncbi:MAG TPA: M36 family metallopeptidase [Thermoanaerobaculia bacterium]|nr:M36 family metallopeptidase [Thermoanaerobaculia bacterium]